MYLFQNALALDPQNVSTLVLFMAAAAWGGMLIVLVADLFADARLSILWKILWLPIIVGVPVIGGFFYSAVCLVRSLIPARQSK